MILSRKYYMTNKGAQWLSGRVLDSRLRGRRFKPHLLHCIVVPEQDTFYPSLVLVQPRKTRPCLNERLLMGHKESNQTNKQNHMTKDNYYQRGLKHQMKHYYITLSHLGVIARKPVFGVSNKARLKHVSSATETCWKI